MTAKEASKQQQQQQTWQLIRLFDLTTKYRISGELDLCINIYTAHQQRTQRIICICSSKYA